MIQIVETQGCVDKIGGSRAEITKGGPIECAHDPKLSIGDWNAVFKQKNVNVSETVQYLKKTKQ